ncbi:MAG TPA: DegV family protein [Desulfobacteria bacterium]|nr:DegV family protein [Desulfobacteria bacterium]
MSKIRIVTDSTADLPSDIVDELGIIVIPLKVSFGREVYRDGVDMQSQEFISRLERDDEFPTTSQPSPGEIVAVYEKIIAKGESIISIHLSGKLSGTVQSARTAKTMTDSRDIHVIDSRTISMGLGLIVMAAAKAANEGKSVAEILALINEKIEKTFLIFLVDTLDYLEKGGRIGKASAFLGTLLKIKPILALDDGHIVPIERVRGKTKALERISEIVADRVDFSKRYRCALIYGNDYSSVAMLRDHTQNSIISWEEPVVTVLGPVIMAHTGPGVVGIVLCPE